MCSCERDVAYDHHLGFGYAGFNVSVFKSIQVKEVYV